MHTIEIKSYTPDQFDAVIDLTIEAWKPVFVLTEHDVPRFVYDAFYPRGWEIRQRDDVAKLLENESANIWLAFRSNKIVGYIGLRIHPEDQMGEVIIIAVSPVYQRQGIGRQLLEFAQEHIRASGMKMMMVETIGDKGHQPARSTYENFGFQKWPVARYFKQL